MECTFLVLLLLEGKRREDACALPKLRKTGRALAMNFARSALECDASSHRFVVQ